MSLHDSPLANPQLKSLALRFILETVRAPAYAADLMFKAGKYLCIFRFHLYSHSICDVQCSPTFVRCSRPSLSKIVFDTENPQLGHLIS